MMRIFRAYHKQACGQGAARLKATPQERKRLCLQAGGWSLWIIMLLVCGYYGHVVWRQHFPAVSDSTGNKATRNYWLSDVHYVFKKNPLPARIEIETDETAEENETPEALLTSENEGTPEADPEDHDALRLRVQQVLKEMDGKQP